MKKLIAFLLFSFSFSAFISAQQSMTDSLLGALKTAGTDTQKVTILYDLCKIQSTAELGKKYADEMLSISNKINYKKGMGLAYNRLGAISRNQGDFKEALTFYFKSLDFLAAQKDSFGIAKLNNNIGESYRLLGDYPTALSYYLKSLGMLEKLDKQKFVATSLNNIAIIYRYQKNYEKALQYNMRSLAIRKKLKDLDGIADSYDNIGIIYFEQKK